MLLCLRFASAVAALLDNLWFGCVCFSSLPFCAVWADENWLREHTEAPVMPKQGTADDFTAEMRAKVGLNEDGSGVMFGNSEFAGKGPEFQKETMKEMGSMGGEIGEVTKFDKGQKNTGI